MRSNKLINFRSTIYGLSRDYGFRIDLYRPTETTNLRTGVKTTTRVKFHIRRAVILPNESFRDFNYSTIAIKLNRDLQLGGLLDSSQRRVLISRKELPINFKLSPNDYIIFNHDRYNIIKSKEMELADYWLVDIKQIEGEPSYEVHEGFIRDKMIFNEGIING